MGWGGKGSLTRLGSRVVSAETTPLRYGITSRLAMFPPRVGKAIVIRQLHDGQHGAWRTAVLFASAMLALILVPVPGRGQSRGDAGIRVVETVDPVSGARYRQTVYDLTRKEIQAVQRALREDGYLGVGWTGQLDHGTVKALGELQEERGLYRCGCVSYETVIALGLKPDVHVTTVAVGGAGVGAPGDAYGSSYQSGWIYPVAVPVYVPVDPDDPDEANLPAGAAVSPTTTWPPPGAVPPGVRPLPPPTRVIPAGSRSPAVPTPKP